MHQEAVDEIIVYDNLSRHNYNLFLGSTLYHTNPFNKIKITFVAGELLDSRKLGMVLEGVDVVIHLAAKVLTPFTTTSGHEFEQTNHWGTAELIYAIEESKVQRLIYMSSTSVYGAAHANDDTPPDPQTLYGISKLRGEEHVRRLIDKMDTYIIRCGNVYGYNRSMRFDAVINRFMFEANFNRRISIHGNGKQSRGFIHISSVAEALAQILQAKVPSGTYNLVEKNLQVLDIVDVLKEIYPDLEFIFVNQHLTLRDLTVDTQLKLSEYLPNILPNNLLRKELAEFKKHFSF
jgi:UDP-glucose 4-epimerase